MSSSPIKGGVPATEALTDVAIDPRSDSPQDEPLQSTGGARLGDFAERYGLLVVWALVIIAFSLLRPETFATWANVENILGSQAVLVILTLGLLVPFTAGEFDVSVSGIASISLVLIGWLNVIHGWPIGLAIAVALGAGLIVGMVNAFFVVIVGVQSIVVTLGTQTLLVGIGLGINTSVTGGISQHLVDAVRTQVFGIPLEFYYGLLLTIVAWYVYSYTPLGRWLYFVGAGRNVARLSGIPVDAVRFGSFLASGLICAFAGVVLAGTIGASDPNVGGTFLLPAFAAAFLGATAIKPGRFNPWGSFIAVYFLVTGITGLQLMGLAGWIEQVFYGTALVLAVALSTLAGRRLAQ